MDTSLNIHTCRSPHLFITKNCEIDTSFIPNDLNIKEISCTTCKTNFFPLNLKNSFACINNNDYLRIEGVTDDKLITGCHKYNKDKLCI